MTNLLLDAISERAERVKSYLLERDHQIHFAHPHLQEAVYSYLRAGGKSLRPAVLLFACGAVGGDEARALPAAAAIELYHTWTLVHDDIIDRDELRRGVPTVHAQFAQRAQTDLGYPPQQAVHYGLTIGILAGDMQQGWCASLLTKLHTENKVNPTLALKLVAELFTRVQCTLMDGEALDVLYAETPIEQLAPEMVLEMLWKKTGVLYEFAGRAGAAIGLDTPDLHDPTPERIAAFTGRCGTAFQIQDDILGVVGDSAKMGKPVGSDIREGKRTLVVLGSLPHMTSTERALTLATLGNPQASPADLAEVAGLLETRGGIGYAKKLASDYINTALEQLAPLPETPAKTLLHAWAQYLIEREF